MKYNHISPMEKISERDTFDFYFEKVTVHTYKKKIAMPLEMFWSNISVKNFNCHSSILKETKSKS